MPACVFQRKSSMIRYFVTFDGVRRDNLAGARLSRRSQDPVSPFEYGPGCRDKVLGGSKWCRSRDSNPDGDTPRGF